MRTRTALAAPVAAITLLGALAGCSTDAGTGGGGEEATSLIASSDAAEQAVLDLLHAEDPDLTVDLQTAPGNTYAQVVATQLAGGTAPDIIRAYPGNGSNLSIVQATENGFFTPLDDLDFAQGLDETQKSVLTGADGKVMAVPVTVSAVGGVYNTTAMDELGLSIPTTWSEVLDLCAAAQSAGRTAYGLGLKDAWTSQFVSYALGATLLPADIAEEQADSDAPFSDTAWREVIQKYSDLKDAGCFTAQPNGTSSANVASEVAAGTSLATISLTTLLGAVREEAAPGTEIEFAAFPATDDADSTALSTGIGVVFALNAKAKHPEEAKKVLEFFATPEAQSVYAKTAGMAPALDGGDDHEADQPTQVIQEFQSEKRSAPWPDQSWPNPNVQQAHFTAIQSLFAGDADVDDVLAALDKAYKN